MTRYGGVVVQLVEVASGTPQDPVQSVFARLGGQVGPDGRSHSSDRWLSEPIDHKSSHSGGTCGQEWSRTL